MKTLIELDDGNFEGQYYSAARVEIINDKGIRQAKHVDIKDLLSALAGATTSECETHRIGKLPQNFYDGAISRDEDLLNGKVIVTVPKGLKTTIYEMTQYEIPFPALLFYFVIEDNRLEETRVYALKGNDWKESSMLYNYPFGNVNTYDHKVCWGDNDLPEIQELNTLDVVCSLFYDSSSNNDYYCPRVSTTLADSNLREVYERLKNKEEFPEKILVRSNTGTLASLLKTLQ